ncbi:hypothetical protein M1O54_00410 [Dehalococcoidia bacterium]|nr:hypothetical protein [Dehalococcoidia bacterium]
MPSVEYKAKVLADGHLSCPESVKERLHLEEGVEVKVVMEIDDSREPLEKETGLTPREGTGLCGIWKDDRSAEEIIGDIYSSRTGRISIHIHDKGGWNGFDKEGNGPL